MWMCRLRRWWWPGARPASHEPLSCCYHGTCAWFRLREKILVVCHKRQTLPVLVWQKNAMPQVVRPIGWFCAKYSGCGGTKITAPSRIHTSGILGYMKGHAVWRSSAMPQWWAEQWCYEFDNANAFNSDVAVMESTTNNSTTISISLQVRILPSL
jgi:hypothetical protein